MTKLTYVLLFLSLFGFAQKKDKDNVISNTADAAKIELAKQKLYAEEYVSALNAFREIEKDNQTDATVKYYVGLCYFQLQQFENAKTTLNKAVEINKGIKPETHLLLGKIYQMEEDFDKAIAAFNMYKSSGATEKESIEEADLLLSQSQNAKSMMASPRSVKIINLGEGINSKYDDKNPCITADARTLVFTTRRPANVNSAVDTEGDGKYFEDIYIATSDSSTRTFKTASDVGSTINSKAHDACTSISPDGKQIFIYYNDLSDKEKKGGNIFVSKVNAGKWRKPVSLGKPINTSAYWEGGACVSPDGKRYFFTSERPGGLGRSDIWMIEKTGKNEWGKPVNLGPEINSPNDEGGMFLAPDGKTLFFCSNNAKSMGSLDVFKTTYENGKWSAPVNLGYPINTPSKEGQLSISADAKYAYLSSDRKGGLGESDIYMIDLQDFAILQKDGEKKASGLSILKGTIREGAEGYGMEDVEILVKDEQGTNVASTNTNESGEYFITLKGGKYDLTIRKKGYKEISEKIDLGTSDKETVSLEKGYLLKK